VTFLFTSIDVKAARTFTADQPATWQTLYARQLGRMEQHACREYPEGLAVFDLPADRIPGLFFLNRKIPHRTGWWVVRTGLRYSDAIPWCRHFARREFLVTDYMLEWVIPP
jgi:phenylalanine-4-hydroxylase